MPGCGSEPLNTAVRWRPKYARFCGSRWPRHLRSLISGAASGNDSRPSAVSNSSYRHERTSRSHGAVLATRNIEDFLDTGISIVNPWAQP